eukprot:XP_011678735.1 PREDICTED: uncharacterized protein LOC105445209 [Strongylocentrotus purpuratus]
MDIQHMRAILHFIGLLILITKFSNGQSVTLTGPSLIQQGTDTVYTCTGGAAPYTFIWEDLSVIPIVNIFINGKAVTNPSTHPKYVNFGVSENEGTSTMTITNTLVEDEGQYKCVELPVGTGNIDGAELTVEVKSIRNLSVKTITESNIDVFEAICEALGGRPDETITWMLDDGPSPCDDTNVTYPAAGEGLSSTRSVCTFQADNENIGQTLKCVISGHQVYDLNGEKTTTLNIQRSPTTDIRVGFQFLEPNLTVSCDIADPTQPIPSIMNYYIYSDGTLIHQSPTGDNDVEVPCSEFDLYTEFTCVAGNYLGNTTSDPARYDPTRSPTTDIRVGFQFLEPNLTVSCDIADPTQPITCIMNYYIYSDGTLIHQSPTGDNDVEVPCSEFDLYTEFTCVAGNYLGNTTSDPARYDPTRSPTTDIRVGFQFLEPNLTVSCDIADPTQPIPCIMNYYIYSDGTLIHQSPTGDNDVEVPCSEFDLYTEFTCVAGNYLGNTTSDPARYNPTNGLTIE